MNSLLVLWESMLTVNWTRPETARRFLVQYALPALQRLSPRAPDIFLSLATVGYANRELCQYLGIWVLDIEYNRQI